MDYRVGRVPEETAAAACRWLVARESVDLAVEQSLVQFGVG
ncbi:hypothetical protein CASFOL_016122 [Castilleja foliolosa]|uniref:Uncharacterized protein n=1 Tax=Castilleja foliolosa TaxID=1961234 RepID=A0ABD3DJF9_9LAMI